MGSFTVTIRALQARLCSALLRYLVAAAMRVARHPMQCWKSRSAAGAAAVCVCVCSQSQISNAVLGRLLLCVCVCVCGQARNAVLESHLPPFLDLVIWGHEHECKPEPEVCVRGHVCVLVYMCVHMWASACNAAVSSASACMCFNEDVSNVPRLVRLQLVNGMEAVKMNRSRTSCSLAVLLPFCKM